MGLYKDFKYTMSHNLVIEFWDHPNSDFINYENIRILMLRVMRDISKKDSLNVVNTREPLTICSPKENKQLQLCKPPIRLVDVANDCKCFKINLENKDEKYSYDELVSMGVALMDALSKYVIGCEFYICSDPMGSRQNLNVRKVHISEITPIQLLNKGPFCK